MRGLRTLCCSKNHVLFIENEMLKENKYLGAAFLESPSLLKLKK